MKRPPKWRGRSKAFSIFRKHDLVYDSPQNGRTNKFNQVSEYRINI